MALYRSRLLSLFVILSLISGSFLSSSVVIANSEISTFKQLNGSGGHGVNSVDYLTIPYDQILPTIDGICDEYAGAVSQAFNDGNDQQSVVFLMHDIDHLFICIAAQLGTNPERYTSLYLDPNGNGSNYVFAQYEDFAFHTSITGELTSFRGNGGAHGYVPDPSLDPYVQTAAKISAGDGFEYSLDLHGLEFGYTCEFFGIAVYHHGFAFNGDDYGWPSNKYYDQPRTWQLAQLGGIRCDNLPNGPIAYVFRGDTANAISFYNLLVSADYSVTLVPLSDVLATDFSLFNLILIADDTGSLEKWGTQGLTEEQVTQINSANKPIIGLGEGGYAFFGQLGTFLGFPQGWHLPQFEMKKSGDLLDPIFFNGVPDNPVKTYLTETNSVDIYLLNGYPDDVTPIGLELPSTDHSPLILQGCRLLWGNSGNPYVMTDYGKLVFMNGVGYMHNVQCSSPPPEACLAITKQANPQDGSTVIPGQVISYTLTVTFVNTPRCDYVHDVIVIDTIPIGTTLVPGSASDGISPGADGSMVWIISKTTLPVTKVFEVVVNNSACTAGVITNSATVQTPNEDPYHANTVAHKLQCQPIELPHQNPDFAEEEITIDPYPLIMGHPSLVRVRISNNTPTNQPINVEFQTSPDHFGIGLSYTTFDSKSVTIPANGNLIVEGLLIPTAPGHWCIQIVVTGPALEEPLITQSNLDVTEELQAGVPDTLTIMVGNPTPDIADVLLVVDNTCAGWSTSITSPVGGVLPDMAPNEVRQATLEVIPPDPITFGVGCHVDVQGWIGSVLIGGIRKLDVPPVHLPHDYQPAWEEPEISFNPDPPIVGSPSEICIELQNPLPVAVAVNLDYVIADFGAGLDFTPVGSQAVTLPANSIAKYCLEWTPSTGGTLHRCVQVTLHQDGYQDETSQRNVDLVSVFPSGLGGLSIPFLVRNPDLVTHALEIKPVIFGIDPSWNVQIQPDPPTSIMAGETLLFHLGFTDGRQKATNSDTPLPFSGDSPRVEVSILMEGAQEGGVTIEFASDLNFLPVVTR